MVSFLRMKKDEKIIEPVIRDEIIETKEEKR